MQLKPVAVAPVAPLSTVLPASQGVITGNVQLTAPPIAQPPPQAANLRSSAPVALAGYEAARRGHHLVGGNSSSRNVTPQRPPAYAFTAGAELAEPRRSLGSGSVLVRPERQASVASSALQTARSVSPVSQALASDPRPAVVVTSKQLGAVGAVGASGMAPGSLSMRAVYLEPSSTSGTATGSIGFPMEDSYASVDTSHTSVDNSNEYTFDVGPGEVKRVVRDPLHWEQLRPDGSPGLQGRRGLVKEAMLAESSTPGVPIDTDPGGMKTPGRTTPQTPVQIRHGSPMVNDLPGDLNGQGTAGFDFVEHDGQRYIVTTEPFGFEAPEPLRAQASEGTVRSVSAESARWARLGTSKKPSWVPAISTPRLFSRREVRNSSRGTTPPPTRSTSSTPNRRRGQCYQDLYADAAERERKRKKKQEELEANEMSQIQAERESSLRATRRYLSNDDRGVLGRTDHHLRRKAELHRLAQQEQRRKYEEEMQACTFQPYISQHNRVNSPQRRHHDEREMERHLRQLAHKQLDVRARLVQLEREWHRTHEKRRAIFLERCKEVEKAKRQELLRLQEHEVPGQNIVVELGEDEMQAIQSEVDAELQVQKSDVDFWARRRVLIESLEGIESRAAPTLEKIDNLPEGSMILESSGFTIGLAQKVRLLIPEANDLSSPRTVASMASNNSNGRLVGGPLVAPPPAPPMVAVAASGSVRSDRHSFGARSAPSEVGSLVTPLGTATLGTAGSTHGSATVAIGSAAAALGSAGMVGNHTVPGNLQPVGAITGNSLAWVNPVRVVAPAAVGGVRPASPTILTQSKKVSPERRMLSPPPVQPPPPIASMGLDLNNDGQAEIFLRGIDLNRDGIPDALQPQLKTSMPRTLTLRQPAR